MREIAGSNRDSDRPKISIPINRTSKISIGRGDVDREFDFNT